MKQLAWRQGFDLLTKKDFSFTFGNQIGWLLCDDLKADNLLLKVENMNMQCLLTDWDPTHWYFWPTKASIGSTCNVLIMILNMLSIFMKKKWQRDLDELLCVWPDSEIDTVLTLLWMATTEDRLFLRLLLALDPLLIRGCYHYAEIGGLKKKERALAFLRKLREFYYYLKHIWE